MHEIITLQFGQPSNYVATHFWNAQESYFTYAQDEESPIDHDIHWRPGIGADGSETFMPRTVIYDLKGGFGSLRKINALYEMQDDKPPQSLWNGQTVVQKNTSIEPSAYQQSLDAGLEPPQLTTSSVRYWSDFNRVFFHPRSIIQLNEYELNSSLQPFEKWSTGEELFASLDKEHDIVDRDLRPFVEEADHMQGIQIMTTIDDAWGGFASRYMERLRDEYGKSIIWTWGFQDSMKGVPRDKRLVRLANKAQTLGEAYKQASLLVPIALPQRSLPRNIVLDASSQWHTSALLATAVESATLPSRLKDNSNRDSLGTITELLNVMGKQTVACLQMKVSDLEKKTEGGEAPHERRGWRDDEADDAPDDLQFDVDFVPPDELGPSRQNGHSEPRLFGQAATIRGETAPVGAYALAHSEEVIRRRHAQQPFSRRYHTTLGFPLPDSFPRIYVDEDDKALKGSVNVTAALSTDSSVSHRLKLLRTNVVRSIGIEDRENLSNELAEMADEYHEGWSSGSDEGDDE